MIYNSRMDDRGVSIIYESGPCLVVNKPPGLLTQAPPGIDSLEVRLRLFLHQRDGVPCDAFLGMAHRLDRPASGALVVGLTLKATQKLGRQFENRWVKKVYWACVEGRVEPADGTWTDCVRKVPGQPRAEIVDAGHPQGRIAVLRYRTLAHALWGTWLEVELETGRTHQVRIQAASRGHSILGDHQYGAQTPFGPQYDDERLRAIALHARQLSFRDPTAHQDVTVVAPVPDAWCGLSLPLQ
jgi:23S rRNA pseudouridine1911/1915/1917 synthase